MAQNFYSSYSVQIMADRGIRLTQNNGDEPSLASFYNFKGIYFEKTGSIDSAIHYYNTPSCRTKLYIQRFGKRPADYL